MFLRTVSQEVLKNSICKKKNTLFTFPRGQWVNPRLVDQLMINLSETFVFFSVVGKFNAVVAAMVFLQLYCDVVSCDLLFYYYHHYHNDLLPSSFLVSFYILLIYELCDTFNWSGTVSQNVFLHCQVISSLAIHDWLCKKKKKKTHKI